MEEQEEREEQEEQEEQGQTQAVLRASPSRLVGPGAGEPAGVWPCLTGASTSRGTPRAAVAPAGPTTHPVTLREDGHVVGEYAASPPSAANGTGTTFLAKKVCLECPR